MSDVILYSGNAFSVADGKGRFVLPLEMRKLVAQASGGQHCDPGYSTHQVGTSPATVGSHHNCQAHREGRMAMAGRAISLVVLASLSACGTDGAEQHPMPAGSPEAGLEAIRATGCAACHVVPGVEWPMGRTGPSLEGFAARPLIAGSLSNDPDTLTAFVRNAPALSPDSAMPPMPLTESQARDVAAYLYTLQPR